METVNLSYEELLKKVKEQEKEIQILKANQNGERKNLFQTLFTDSYSIKLIIDFETGQIINANKSACKFYGYSFDELTSMNINQINTLPPEDVKKEMQNAKSGVRNYFNFKHRLKNGQIKHVEVHSGKILIENKTYLYSIIKDITEQKAIENELKEKTSFLSTVMETSPVGITIVDKTGKITYANSRAEQILGLVKEEITSRTYDAPLWKHTELDGSPFPDEKQPFNVVKKTLKTVFDIQHGITWPDGKVVLLSINATPLKDNTGKFNGMIASIENITERKQAEEIIKIQNRELKKSNNDKDRFIKILAHDLKNPFNSLLGFSNLLLTNLYKYDIHKIERQLKIINKVTHQTYELLEQILLWAKAQSGKLKIEKQYFKFLETTNEIINVIQNQANEKHISINCFETEKIILSADLNMFKTIMRNLISNAIKFTNQNGQINIYAEKIQENIIITVSDNGIGIDKEAIPKLWEFSDNYSTIGTNNEKGTGLGLTLCKELIEKHGGQIWVESEVGKGSDFKFTLPFRDV